MNHLLLLDLGVEGLSVILNAVFLKLLQAQLDVIPDSCLLYVLSFGRILHRTNR